MLIQSLLSCGAAFSLCSSSFFLAICSVCVCGVTGTGCAQGGEGGPSRFGGGGGTRGGGETHSGGSDVAH
jgi:hypothetical protein